MVPKIDIDRKKITAFCRKHHIRKLWLFGSALRDDFSDDSDVDVLYEFEPDHHIGWKIISIEDELSRIIGRKVDFVSEKHLHKRIRNHPAFQKVLIYD